jgi:hypothetical protein
MLPSNDHPSSSLASVVVWCAVSCPPTSANPRIGNSVVRPRSPSIGEDSGWICKIAAGVERVDERGGYAYTTGNGVGYTEIGGPNSWRVRNGGPSQCVLSPLLKLAKLIPPWREHKCWAPIQRSTGGCSERGHVVRTSHQAVVSSPSISPKIHRSSHQ